MKPGLHVNEEELAGILLEAHLPSLLMALVHLTGDTRFLGADFALTYGAFDDGQGGLSPEKQVEIRAAAQEAIRTHLSGDTLLIRERGR
jgi:4-hydroxyacetophenone monooxygenase